jgi:tRNA nucleotidyltransferase (CCA-adding enzyme)
MTDFKIPLLVKKTLKKIEEHGFEAYIVGGAIRDILMGKLTYDWDFTTNAKPQKIQEIFPDSFYDNKFGTVGITAEELKKQLKLKSCSLKKDHINPEDVFEITTFRSEQGYKDRRHPDKVTWGRSLKEDLKRRDFTINAIALKLEKENNKNKKHKEKKDAWILIDPFNGRKDIKTKLIRAVGNPGKRFSEDALRMMRGIRIACQLQFSLEEKTLKAIRKNSHLLKQISKERVRDEFFKIIKSDYPADGIKLLFSSGLLRHILPELEKTRGVEQAGHHLKDVWNHSLDSLKESPSKDKIVRLATLLHDIGKPVAQRIKNKKITFYGHEVVGERMVKKIAKRLRFSKKDTKKLVNLVRHHMFAYSPKMTNKAIKRFIKRVGRENINDMMMLRIGDRKGGGSKATSWRLRELQQRIGELMYEPLEIKDLKVNGRDVMRILKIKPGPKVGKILEQLFEEVLEDPDKNKRDYLLKKIKKLK